MNGFTSLAVSVLLLAANAFFVAAEFSLISARRDRLEAMAAQGKRRALTVIRAGEHLSMMLTAAQLGITICSILLGRIAEPGMAHLLVGPFHQIGISGRLVHPAAFTLALALVALLHILLGEMVPKNLALAGPERAALWLIPSHLAWLRVARPVIAVYNGLATLSLRAFRIEPKDEIDSAVSAPELAEMIGESRSEGLLDAEEHRRLTQALGTQSRIVADVLIPVQQARTVPLLGAGTTLGEVERAVVETGFSRYPVRTPDGALVGYVHIKDVLDHLADPDAGPDTEIGRAQIRPLPTLTSGTPLNEALGRLRRAGSHLGRVDDGVGATLGIVTLEDLAEEFVGTVRDATHRMPDLVPRAEQR
ncbi:MAG: HlyC/CorC family transporter [Mycobacteriaceae bacterium]|nr:HlyC/CorC family transporter [Mycobacteriaceae bacterium]